MLDIAKRYKNRQETADIRANRNKAQQVWHYLASPKSGFGNLGWGSAWKVGDGTDGYVLGNL